MMIHYSSRISRFCVTLFNLQPYQHLQTSLCNGTAKLTSLSLAALTVVGFIPAAFPFLPEIDTLLAGLGGKSLSIPDTSFFSGLKPVSSPIAVLPRQPSPHPVYPIIQCRKEEGTKTHFAQKRRSCRIEGSTTSYDCKGDTHPCSLSLSKHPKTHLCQSVRTK